MPTTPPPRQFTVAPAQVGQRLDYFLRQCDAALSQRTCKRLCAEGLLLLNGKATKPGQFLAAGDVLLLLESRPDPCAEVLYAQVHIVRVQSVPGGGALYALAKPAGLHSVSLSGSNSPSLEVYLNAHWSELWDNWQQRRACEQAIYPYEDPAAGLSCCGGEADIAQGPPMPRLLNRLDRDTSGLVMAGDASGRRHYLEAEESGGISKSYLTLAHGFIEQEFVISKILCAEGKTKMRSLNEIEADAKRHTRVTPLAYFVLADLKKEVVPLSAAQSQAMPAGAVCTLALAQIAKGARHQIRAHLAGEGHSIVGDALYAQADGKEELACPRMFLHHMKIELPGFSAQLTPDWPTGLQQFALIR